MTRDSHDTSPGRPTTNCVLPSEAARIPPKIGGILEVLQNQGHHNVLPGAINVRASILCHIAGKAIKCGLLLLSTFMFKVFV